MMSRQKAVSKASHCILTTCGSPILHSPTHRLNLSSAHGVVDPLQFVLEFSDLLLFGEITA